MFDYQSLVSVTVNIIVAEKNLISSIRPSTSKRCSNKISCVLQMDHGSAFFCKKIGLIEESVKMRVKKVNIETFMLCLSLSTIIQPHHAFLTTGYVSFKGQAKAIVDYGKIAGSNRNWRSSSLRSEKISDAKKEVKAKVDTERPAKNWSQEQYLKFHQTVGKRKTIRRLIEIISVLSGKIFRPLVCSFVQDPHLVRTTSDWDEFWLRQHKALSNAERVAKGLPTLGPTFLKVGQALATRPDIMHVPLAEALANIQDRVAPFDDFTARRIVRRELKLVMAKNKQRVQKGQRNKLFINNDEDLQKFMESLSAEPVASGSIAQVYKGTLTGYGNVAVKVQRPGIRRTAEKDATLFHTIATWIQNLKWPDWTPVESSRGEPIFGSTQIVKAVDEFTARVLEDMDFEREVDNMKLFANMYCYKRGSSPDVKVVVPEAISELCTRHLIVMEWIEGTKLTDVCLGCDDSASAREVEENLALVRKAVEMTLSQLLTVGLLHADPHESNLIKVHPKVDGEAQLGYLDFGLVNTIPQRFRDGIVAATCQIVFARNVAAVADLCVDLGLLPETKLKDEEERARFINALEKALDDVLIWPKDQKGRSTAVPKVRFERALPCISNLIANFEFSVPPYFLNNARAIATLEGIGLQLDPNFNIIRVIYPYSINHLMRHPDVSKKSEETFLDICRNPETKLFDYNRFMKLLNDWSLLTGLRKRKIYWDLISSVGTRRVMTRIWMESLTRRIRYIQIWYYNCFLKPWERGWYEWQPFARVY